MLLILMYHRVCGSGLNPQMLLIHLRYLKDHYKIVLPGEALESGHINVCLTFDDATADFYQEAFPILNTLGMRALLAVPTGWIAWTSTLTPKQRLIVQETAAKSGRYTNFNDGLCTWRELKVMQDTGTVCCVSHGHNHLDMSAAATDVELELQLSQTALLTHCGQNTTTFIYPYGKTNPHVQAKVHKHFVYAMRIGSAINWDWSGHNGLLYRVNAEAFWPVGRGWSHIDTMRWQCKYLLNRLRGT